MKVRMTVLINVHTKGNPTPEDLKVVFRAMKSMLEKNGSVVEKIEVVEP